MDYNNVVRMYKKEEPLKSIADKLDISYPYVQKILFEMGEDVWYPNYLKGKKDKILKLRFEENKTMGEIVEILNGYDSDWLRRWFNRNNIDSKTYNQLCKESDLNYIENNKTEVLYHLFDYKSYQEIADIFNVSKSVIAQKIKEWGSNRYDGYVKKYFELDDPKDVLGVHHDRFFEAYIKGKSYEQVVKDCNISMGTVKSSIHRAKKRIDEKL